MHVGRIRARAFEIGPGSAHLRPNHLAGVNQLLDFDIRIRLDASAGANCGYAGGQIQAWEAVAHFAIDRRRAAHRKEHVIVHADQARNDGVTVEIEHLRVGGGVRVQRN